MPTEVCDRSLTLRHSPHRWSWSNAHEKSPQPQSQGLSGRPGINEPTCEMPRCPASVSSNRSAGSSHLRVCCVAPAPWARTPILVERWSVLQEWGFPRQSAVFIEGISLSGERDDRRGDDDQLEGRTRANPPFRHPHANERSTGHEGSSTPTWRIDEGIAIDRRLTHCQDV